MPIEGKTTMLRYVGTTFAVVQWPRKDDQHDGRSPNAVFLHSFLCTAAQSARAAPMQPRSNREKELQKYYALLQLAQGGHPLPCSTMHYG